MAHKTLVGGAAYEITGGKTLLGGTSYSVKNGKVLVDGTAYDISFLLPPNVLNMWAGNYDDHNAITCIAYANGYWVVGGYALGSDNSTSYARIAYATKLNGTWTRKDLWSGTNYQEQKITCIAYANGYWVVGGGYYNGTGTVARIAYATAPNGTWTTTDLWGGTNRQNGGLDSLAYGNGIWAAVGCMLNSSGIGKGKVSYATTPSGTWTTTDLSLNYTSCIAYANGYWVVGGYQDDYKASITYATTPSGTWTTKTLWSGTSGSSNGYYVDCIAYANGYWVVGGRDYATYAARIAYATTPSGTWTTKDLWTSSSSYYDDAIHSIAFGNGYWVAGGRYRNAARIAYTTNLSGTWTTKDVTSASSKIYALNYMNGYWLLGENYWDYSTDYARLAYAGTPAELGDNQ